MKSLVIAGAMGLIFLVGCGQNPGIGGDQVRGDEVRSDTPVDMDNLESNHALIDSNNVIETKDTDQASMNQ